MAVAPRAGELARQPHLTTLAGRARMSLLAMTRVTAQRAIKMLASASLLPTTLPMAVGAVVALVALAVVLLAALGAPAVEAATCLGIRFGRL